MGVVRGSIPRESILFCFCFLHLPQKLTGNNLGSALVFRSNRLMCGSRSFYSLIRFRLIYTDLYLMST